MNLDNYAEEENAIGDWTKEKVLGTGGFGTVNLWRNSKTKDAVALKKCRWGQDTMMTPKHRQRWRLEIDIMKRLDHPNVVKTIDVPPDLDVPNAEIPLMAMEYCCGGDLRKMLSKPENCCGVPEKEIRMILRHAISAVEYLHSMRIIHRDLKPENIVIQESNGKRFYKLIDLGYAKELDQGSLCTSFVGTLQYLAPELFLSHTYSSSVDFWSLGLLTHEVITGHRPFFPNLSPAQWIPLVKQKTSEDICGFLSEQNKAAFSKEIFYCCSISRTLQHDIEEWLQLMLEFDPKLRGKRNGTVVIYQVLKDFLNKKILRVFYCETCCVLEYELHSGCSVSTLKEWLKHETGVSVENQEILQTRGKPLDPNADLFQLWTNPEEDESMLFLFHTSPYVKIPEVSPRIPRLVERIMRNPRHLVGYEIQRASWMEAVFLSQQETKLYKNLLQAFKVSLMHLLMMNSSVHKQLVKMQKKITEITAKSEFFKTILEHDIQNCNQHTASKESKLASVMNSSWQKTLNSLEQIKDLQKQSADCESISTVGNAKALDLQQSPYARSKGNISMEENYQAILGTFAELKLKPKDQRSIKCDNTDMVKLLCTCLRTREKVFGDIFSLLRIANELKKEMCSLRPQLFDVTEKIENFDRQLTCWQNERQESIWKLITSLTERVSSFEKSLSSKSTPVLQHSERLHNSVTPVYKTDQDEELSFLSYGSTLHDETIQSLSQIVEKCTLDSQKIRQENQEIMNSMMSVLSLQENDDMQDDLNDLELNDLSYFLQHKT